MDNSKRRVVITGLSALTPIGLSVTEFWNSMMEFLRNGEGKRRVILIGLGGVYDHWSIVDSITDKQIRLFDSFKLKRLNRNRCATMRRSSSRPHLLFPTHTYFLS